MLPAHNEALSIGATLTEFFRIVSGLEGVPPIRFVVSEDGSTDGTADVVRELSARLPIKLLSDRARKGYSRAVIDGFRATEAPLVGFIDSDGQCDPADFAALHRLSRGHDLVVGYRNPRVDPWVRLWMSGAFKTVYRALFTVPVRDPSCPYLLMTRDALRRILEGEVGVLKQGFWWEFLARAAAADLSIVETPVRHRPRASGTTQVYRPTRVPRIAAEHLVGLFRLRRELAARRRGRPVRPG